MRVKPYQHNDKDLPTGVFSSTFWCAVFGPAGKGLVVHKGDKSVAALVLYKFKKFGKDFLIQPPFALNCGLSQISRQAKAYSKNTERKRILRAVAEYLSKEYSYAYVNITLPTEIKDVQPFIEAGFKIDVGYTYLLDISPSRDDLRAALSSERRKNIKDARGKDLLLQKNSDPEGVINRVQSTLEQSGINYNFDYLRKIVGSDFSYTLSASSKDEIVAAAVIVFDDDRAYYIAGGASKDPKHAGASTMLLWEAILEAKDKGISTFDFCGSSVPSIEKFFRGFGGELTPYFRIKKNTALPDMLKSAKQRLGL